MQQYVFRYVYVTRVEVICLLEKMFPYWEEKQ